MAIIKDGLNPTERWSFSTLNDLCFAVNGIDKNLCYDGIVVTNAGIVAPPATCTFSANIDGDLVQEGQYYYKFCYYNINKGIESDPSPISAVMTAGASASTDGIRITIPTDSTIDTQVTHVQVYRTANGGSVYYYDGQKAYTGTSITYDSTVADGSLVTVMGELNATSDGNVDVRGVPPVCPYIKAKDGRIGLFGGMLYDIGTVTVVNGNATVTGSGTLWTSGMVGWWFKKDGDSRKYVISSVTSATVLVLTQTYAGTGTAGSNYDVYSEASTFSYSYIDLNGNPEPESFPSTYWLPVNPDDGDEGTGLGIVHNQWCLCKKNHLYILSGTSPSDFTLTAISSPGGFISHWSLANDDLGNLIGASEKGVYITDGNSLISIADETIQNIFSGENNPPFSVDKSRLKYCHGVYDRLNKKYRLWVSSNGSSITDKCLVCDFNKVEGVMIGWSVETIRANASAIIEDSDGSPQVFFGDTTGFVCYVAPTATNDGAGIAAGETRRGTATAGASTTLTQSTATFNTTGNGLKGVWVKILSGTGAGQERKISSNTATVLTIDPAWTVTPTATSVYAIGYIDAFWLSKVFDLGDLKDKILEEVRVVFKTVTTAASLFIKHYTNLTATQTGDTKYVDLTATKGEHQTRFARNRAIHHQLKIGICDTDKPCTIYEMGLNFSKHGRETSEKEKRE